MLTIISHPLITHKITQLRRKETDTKDFRQSLNEVSGLMAFEITRDLPLKEVYIETPVCGCYASELINNIILVPVLRAGLGMVDGITTLIPAAKIGHIGIYRDHESLLPISYYAKFPAELSDAVVMVLDPMLATGGSASASIQALKDKGAKSIKLVCIVGTPEGVNKIENDHPDVMIYLAAMDEGLTDQGYIIPGLGDAGDRIFGTK